MTGSVIIRMIDIVRSETRLHGVRLWGQPRRVRGVLVPVIYGDGMQLMWLQPAATRPNFYLFYGHSKWELSNWDNGDNFCDHVDEVYDDIEDHFGGADEEYEDSIGRLRHKHNNWPALDTSCGCAWGAYEVVEAVVKNWGAAA